MDAETFGHHVREWERLFLAHVYAQFEDEPHDRRPEHPAASQSGGATPSDSRSASAARPSAAGRDGQQAVGSVSSRNADNSATQLVEHLWRRSRQRRALPTVERPVESDSDAALAPPALVHRARRHGRSHQDAGCSALCRHRARLARPGGAQLPVLVGEPSADVGPEHDRARPRGAARGGSQRHESRQRCQRSKSRAVRPLKTGT